MRGVKGKRRLAAGFFARRKLALNENLTDETSQTQSTGGLRARHLSLELGCLVRVDADLAGSGPPPLVLIYLAGLSGPLVMAVLLTLAADGLKGLADLTRRIWPRNFSPRWLVLALGLPPALGLGSLWLAHWLFREAFVPPHPTFLFITGYFFMTLLRSGPLSEEFGWRGFLLPGLLKRFSPAPRAWSWLPSGRPGIGRFGFCRCCRTSTSRFGYLR